MKWLVFMLVLTLAELPENVQGGAPCPTRCQWLSWNSWSACSQTCGGGTRSRSRPLCCDTSLDFDACVNACGLQNEPSFQREDCNEHCYNGGTFTFYCKCAPGYFDACCRSEVICATPQSISNGGYTGSNFKYDDVVEYFCNADYNMTSGTAERTCRGSYSSYWTGVTPQCTFVKTCNSNPCQNGGTCVDGLDQYVCLCEDGWSGTNCEFDIVPPSMTNCSNNKTYITGEQSKQVDWMEPMFEDPMNSSIIITTNYQESLYTFPWGEYVVQYVADKERNGLRTECTFNINVYPIPCQPLTPPINGAIACNGWSSRFTEVCFVFCPIGTHLPIVDNEITEVYVCGAAGQWMTPYVATECITGSSMASEGDSLHYYADETNIRNNYITKLNSSDFSDMCSSPQWGDRCQAHNVFMEFGAVDK